MAVSAYSIPLNLLQGFYVINGYRFQKMFWFVAVESARPLIDKLLLYVTVELEVMGPRSA